MPITLFEAADLWKEGFLTRFPPGAGKGLPQKHPLHRKRDYVNRPDVVYTQHRVDTDRQEQGVLLVTEPHSELNAGLVVVFSSTHPSIFDWGEWTRRCRRLPDTEFNSLLASASKKVVQEFLKLLTGFLHRTLSSQDLTPHEKQQWVQSGLALSPLVATCHSWLHRAALVRCLRNSFRHQGPFLLGMFMVDKARVRYENLPILLHDVFEDGLSSMPDLGV